MVVGQKLFDGLGNEIIIKKIDNNQIEALKKQLIKVTYNAGQNCETYEKSEVVIYKKDDIGIKLFFNNDDLENHEKLIISDLRYFKNKRNILQHFDQEYKKTVEKIQKSAPTGPILDEQLKDKIISEYYSKKISYEQEKNFNEKYGDSYFGRIDLDTRFYQSNLQYYFDKHFYDKIYISKGLYKSTSDGGHIVNWRSPIASMYYDNENTSLTRKHYVDVFNEYLHGREIGNPFNVYKHELMLKRNYSFKPLRYNNTYIAGNEFYSEGTADSFLMEVLFENRSNHRITDIIKTIQSNQNKIIRQEKKINMVVQGCAGSGKTMILLHRLSYLKFNKYLPSSTKTKIITPNNNFSVFIKDLAISLELEGIERITMFDYYLSVAYRYQSLYTTSLRENVQGEKINKREVLVNKKAIQFLDSENICENTDVNDEILNNYYTSSFFDNVNSLYKYYKDKLFELIHYNELVVITQKTNLDIGNTEILSDMSFLDKLSNLSKEIFNADKKLQKEINNLKDDIEKAEITVQKLESFHAEILELEVDISLLHNNLELISKNFNETKRLYNLINNLNQIPSTLNNIISQKNTLLETYLTQGSNANNSINNFDIEIEKINQKIQLLSVFNVFQKRELTKRKQKIKIQKNILIKDIESKIAHLEEQAYGLVKKVLPNIENNKNLERYLEIISRTIQSSQTSLDKLLDIKSPIDNVIIIDYFKQQILDMVTNNKVLINAYGVLKKYLNNDGFNGDIKKYIEEYNKKISELFQNTGADTDVGVVNLINKISVCIEAFGKIRSLLELEEEIDKLNKKIFDLNCKKKSQEPNLLSETEINIVDSIDTLLSNRGQFALDTYKKIRDYYRNEYQIKSHHEIYGKHELLLLIYIYYLHCGELKDGEQLLFIDEGQDYSASEYFILKLINGTKCNFNIFGDINQCINMGRGIKEWKSVCKLMGCNYYIINENYRNTVEITDFTNKKFKFKSLPIGIHGGPVEFIHLEQLSSKIKEDLIEDENSRIAIITNNSNMLSKYKPLYYNKNNFFIGNVIQAKGLEFDNVYVLPTGMNLNEEYIAYTRALNKLCIVNGTQT
ncbi:MAG: hypothetical protein ACOX1U_09325 [Saccharofermentanales bacterium]